MAADLLEVAVTENAVAVSGRKNLKTAAKSVGGKTLNNNWLVVGRKRVQAKSFQQNLQNKPIGRKEIFSQKFLINHVKQFSTNFLWQFLGIVERKSQS